MGRALPALQILTVSMRCATLQQTPTLLANTVMPTRMVVCQGAQMTAYAPQIIPSVGMVVDLIFVAATLMKTVQRPGCATLVHMNATKNQRKVVTLTLTVLLKHVMSLGLITPVTIVILITSVNQAVLMMGSAQRTNQSVEQVDNLLMSVLEMMIVRMVSVMSTILLTILSANIVKMGNANLAVLTPVTALMGTSVMLISAQLMRARLY